LSQHWFQWPGVRNCVPPHIILYESKSTETDFRCSDVLLENNKTERPNSTFEIANVGQCCRASVGLQRVDQGVHYQGREWIDTNATALQGFAGGVPRYRN
jgi:hypothetical protein